MVKVVAALLLSLAFANVAFEPHSPVVTQDAVDAHNNNPSSKWKAHTEWVGNMTVAEAKAMMGTDLSVPNPFPKKSFGALADFVTVPQSFDSRTQWSGCIHPIRNQERCGSCWAFSASEVLSDRFCISENVNEVLSPQWLVSCDTSNDGCNGGNLPLVWQYMESNGIPKDSCDPYISGGGQSHTGSCTDQCQDQKFYKATNIGGFYSIDNAKMDIMSNGPVQTGFTVYQDFMSYTSGIYEHSWGSQLGGHAVKIVGWGNQDGTDYWIVANSWGASWGIDGFFWIGTDQCGISDDIYAGHAGTIITN